MLPANDLTHLLTSGSLWPRRWFYPVLMSWTRTFDVAVNLALTDMSATKRLAARHLTYFPQTI